MPSIRTLITYSIRVSAALGGSYLIYWYAGPIASVAMRYHADLLCPPPASTQLGWWDWGTAPSAMWDSAKYFAGCGAAKEQASHWVFEYAKYYAESYYAKAALPVTLFYLPNYHSWTYSAFKRVFGKNETPIVVSPFADIPVEDMVELFTDLRHGKEPAKAETPEVLFERINSRLNIIKSQYAQANEDSDENEPLRIEVKKYELSEKSICTLLKISKARHREKQIQKDEEFQKHHRQRGIHQNIHRPYTSPDLR